MAFLEENLSCFYLVYDIKHKSGMIDKANDVIAKVTAGSHKLERFRSHNLKEFVSKDKGNLLRKQNIVHEISAPYTPLQNGWIQGQIRTIEETAKSLFHFATITVSGNSNIERGREYDIL